MIERRKKQADSFGAREYVRRFIDEIERFRAASTTSNKERRIAYVADMPRNQHLSYPEREALRDILATHRRQTFRVIMGSKPTL
jgi:hypothetical protein